MSCDPRMHTGIFMRSPYAYRDLLDPRMHTGIALDPRMHTGITCQQSPYAYGEFHAIPVCIRGSSKSPYAWDFYQLRVHTGINGRFDGGGEGRGGHRRGRTRARGRGQREREGEGGRGRAGEDGKQQEWASDDGAAWRRGG